MRKIAILIAEAVFLLMSCTTQNGAERSSVIGKAGNASIADAEIQYQLSLDIDPNNAAYSTIYYYTGAEGAFPRSRLYVSASGSDKNDGLSQNQPLKTLARALAIADTSPTKTIVVIGTLNNESEHGGKKEGNCVFAFAHSGSPILITGVENTPTETRAVLSAAGTDKVCVSISNGSAVRFAHIEISGSKKAGLEVWLNSSVALGTSAFIKNNSGGGVVVYGPKEEVNEQHKPASFTLDGGVIENNLGQCAAGVYVAGNFAMKTGSIRNNDATGEKSVGGGILVVKGGTVDISGGDITRNQASAGGGGIFIDSGGSVTMTGGNIAANSTTAVGGGVCIWRGGIFLQKDGSVSGNTASRDSDIFQKN
jgi:hypothetical protein